MKRSTVKQYNINGIRDSQRGRNKKIIGKINSLKYFQTEPSKVLSEPQTRET